MFDPRLHPAGLSDQDLSTLRDFGLDGAVAVADASPGRTSEAILEHFDELVTRQLPRLERAGVRAACALGIHPAVVPRRGLLHLLQVLPSLLGGGRVVALGLIGLARGGDAEEEAFTEQLRLARRFKLPVLVTTPVVDRERLTRRILTLLQAARVPASTVLVDGASARTVKTIKALGFNAGLTLHPDAISVEQAVTIVRALGPEQLVLDTAAGDGASDMLALARAEHRLLKAGLSRAVVARVTGKNAAALLGLEAA